MTVTAIIPARAGSKGIPNKNMQELGGVPLVLHSVFHACDSTIVDRVIVSTDSPEVAAVCEGLCEVSMRPAHLCTDEATTDAVLLHHAADGGVLVLLQPTSPFRTSQDVDKTIRNSIRGSAFTACQVPFAWLGPSYSAAPVCYDPRNRPNRQTATPEWVENGAVYAVKAGLLLEHGHRMPQGRCIVSMGWLESMQIDTPEELELARRLWPVMRGTP